MCVCVCVCMYVSVRVCVYMSIHVCISVCMCVYACMCVVVSVWVQARVREYVHVSFVCISMCSLLREYISFSTCVSSLRRMYNVCMYLYEKEFTVCVCIYYVYECAPWVVCLHYMRACMCALVYASACVFMFLRAYAVY